jgi:hypothetical protein
MKQDEAHWQGLWWLLLLCCRQVRSVLGCHADSVPALVGPAAAAAAVLLPGK